MQTGSKISFYNDSRTSFRVAATEQHKLLGTYVATSIVYADHFGQYSEITIEFQCETAWALACLTPQDNGNVSSRARYVRITLPSGIQKTLLVGEADIEEVDSEKASISLKAYSPEYWLTIVPSSIASANTNYNTSQKYSYIISSILTTYSIGSSEEKINGVAFRDLPILAYDASYEPTDNEKRYYGVIKHDIDTSPVDSMASASISSTDVSTSYPEPQGTKLNSLQQAFPYLISQSGGTQKVEYRQDFDMILIPAPSPYNDGGFWWRWVMRPRNDSGVFISRSSGTIIDDAKMHISNTTSKLVYLPPDADNNMRRSTASIGGSLLTGVWASMDAKEASASGINGSDMTASDATSIASADAASITPITIDATSVSSESIRPGMKALIRFGYQTIPMLINEVDYYFDEDSGWSVKMPLTAKEKSISYIYTPKKENDEDEDIRQSDYVNSPYDNPDYDNPDYDNPDYSYNTPGIDDGSIADLPEVQSDNPYIPDDSDNNNDKNNPIDTEIVEVMGDNAGRSSVIRTKDGRLYSLTTDNGSTLGDAFLKPVVRKIDGVPSDAKFVSEWSTTTTEKDAITGEQNMVSSAYMVSATGMTLYRIKITQGTSTAEVVQGALPGKFISIYSTDKNLNYGFWVYTEAGKYAIKDSAFTGISFSAATGDYGGDGWITGIRQVVNNGKNYFILADNGYFNDSGKMLMPAPMHAKPVGIISPTAIIYSSGVYYQNTSTTKWKKAKGVFDGNIIGYASTLAGFIGSDGVVYTSNSIYYIENLNNGIKATKIYTTNGNDKIYMISLSPSGNLLPSHMAIVAALDGGGYISMWGQGSSWEVGKKVNTSRITAWCGFELSPTHVYKNGQSEPIAGTDDVFSWSNAWYATKDGLYSPSLTGSGLQVSLPNNGIKSCAGSYPYTYASKVGDSTAIANDGKSVWYSDSKVWKVNTTAKNGEAIKANEISEITNLTGSVRSVAEADDGFIFASNTKGIIDDSGSRKDSDIILTNPTITPCSYDGGVFVSSEEDGLWKVLPGSYGRSGVENTMIKQVPALGNITYVNSNFASGDEEAWLGDRASLWPIPTISKDSLITDPVWIMPSLAVVLFKNSPFGDGNGNIGIVQKTLRRAMWVEHNYNHIQIMKGDTEKWFVTPHTNMDSWDGVAIAWNDDGYYCYIASKILNSGKPLNLFLEYTMPAGESVAGVVYGYGIVSKSGTMYLLSPNGEITSIKYSLGKTVDEVWRVSGGNIDGGGVIMLSNGTLYELQLANAKYSLYSIQGIGGTTIRSSVYTSGSSAYIATDAGVYIYTGTNNVASRHYEGSDVKAIFNANKMPEIGTSKELGVLKNDGLYELDSNDLSMKKYDTITGSVFDVIPNDRYSFIVSTDDGVWLVSSKVALYKISDIILQTGVSYPPNEDDKYSNVIRAAAISSTGEVGTITSSYDRTGAVWSSQGFSIDGKTNSIHYGAGSGHTNFFGEHTYGFLPQRDFKSAPWLTSKTPHAQFGINRKYSGDTNWGRTYGYYGAWIGRFFTLQTSSYGKIKNIWFSGGYETALVLTEKALLSVNASSNFYYTTPIIEVIQNVSYSDNIEFIGRDDASPSRYLSQAPYVLINGALKYVKSEQYTGTTRWLYRIHDITNITGTILYANPAQNNETDYSTGFVITNTGFFTVKNGVADKITGTYTNADGSASTKALTPLTKQPVGVGLVELWREYWTDGNSNVMVGTPIICRSSEDGGGVCIMGIKQDGTLYSLLEVNELKGMQCTLVAGGGSMSGMARYDSSITNTYQSCIIAVGEKAYALAVKRGIGNTNRGVNYSIKELKIDASSI